MVTFQDYIGIIPAKILFKRVGTRDALGLGRNRHLYIDGYACAKNSEMIGRPLASTCQSSFLPHTTPSRVLLYYFGRVRNDKDRTF